MNDLRRVMNSDSPKYQEEPIRVLFRHFLYLRRIDLDRYLTDSELEVLHDAFVGRSSTYIDGRSRWYWDFDAAVQRFAEITYRKQIAAAIAHADEIHKTKAERRDDCQRKRKRRKWRGE
jgi:hypothetical protein